MSQSVLASHALSLTTLRQKIFNCLWWIAVPVVIISALKGTVLGNNAFENSLSGVFTIDGFVNWNSTLFSFVFKEFLFLFMIETILSLVFLKFFFFLNPIIHQQNYKKYKQNLTIAIVFVFVLQILFLHFFMFAVPFTHVGIFVANSAGVIVWGLTLIYLLASAQKNLTGEHSEINQYHFSIITTFVLSMAKAFFVVFILIMLVIVLDNSLDIILAFSLFCFSIIYSYLCCKKILRQEWYVKYSLGQNIIFTLQFISSIMIIVFLCLLFGIGLGIYSFLLVAL